MGAIVEYTTNTIRVQCSGKCDGRVGNPDRPLAAVAVNMQDMPDVAMTLAVLALFATGTTTISGISSWQVKETNRLFAISTELGKLGASCMVTDNSISITPPATVISNIAIDTYDDHRMAMAFSLLAIGGIAVTINDYQCVKKTFPDYFDIFSKICYDK